MNAALLVVDVQRALVDWLVPERRATLLATIDGLLKRAHEANVPVVYVRHQDEELRAGTSAWQIADQIAPRANETIVEKRFRDSFRETTLASELERLETQHLVVCGMQSEYCIDATIREAERRGYKVTLVQDGHATYPADGLSEESIIAHVHRVANGSVAQIIPAGEIFTATFG